MFFVYCPVSGSSVELVKISKLVCATKIVSVKKLAHLFVQGLNVNFFIRNEKKSCAVILTAGKELALFGFKSLSSFPAVRMTARKNI